MDETTRQVFYCGTCRGYIGPTGERVPYESPDIIVWVECSSCLMRRTEQEVAEEAKRRREEERARPRECQLEGCGTTFTPGTAWQKYCTPEHRWRAHRLAKARVRGR